MLYEMGRDLIKKGLAPPKQIFSKDQLLLSITTKAQSFAAEAVMANLNKLFHLDFWRDHIIDALVHLERSHSVLKSTFCPTTKKFEMIICSVRLYERDQ